MMTTLHVNDVDTTAISPDGHVRIVLEWLDEIHFGPPFFALWIQNARSGVDSFWGPGRNEYYGGVVIFSSDGRIVFLERWNSIKQPDIDVVAIDLRSGSEVIILHLGSGFLRGIDQPSPSTNVNGLWMVHFDKFDGKDWQRQSQAVTLPTADAWRSLDWLQMKTS